MMDGHRGIMGLGSDGHVESTNLHVAAGALVTGVGIIHVNDTFKWTGGEFRGYGMLILAPT